MAELVNMADQFKGLPMEELIGGPLMAVCDAQTKLAKSTAQYIKEIGNITNLYLFRKEVVSELD